VGPGLQGQVDRDAGASEDQDVRGRSVLTSINQAEIPLKTETVVSNPTDGINPGEAEF